MPIRFFCPECNKPLSIGKRKAGTTIVCPACARQATVPAASDFQKRPGAAVPCECGPPAPETPGKTPWASGTPAAEPRQVAARGAGRWCLVAAAVPAAAIGLCLAFFATVVLPAGRDAASGLAYVAAPPSPQDDDQVPGLASSAGDMVAGVEPKQEAPSVVLPSGALDLPAQAAAAAPITPLPPVSPSAVPAELPRIPPPMLADVVGRPEDLRAVAPPAAQKPRPTNLVYRAAFSEAALALDR